MIVLDTNVLSEMMRPEPDSSVAMWLRREPADEVFVTAITEAELRYGVERLAEGRRRAALRALTEGLFTEDFGGRVLPFSGAVAAHYADIAASRERRGHPIGVADAQIAAICRFHGAELATRNVKDFTDTGVGIHNPWKPETS